MVTAGLAGSIAISCRVIDKLKATSPGSNILLAHLGIEGLAIECRCGGAGVQKDTAVKVGILGGSATDVMLLLRSKILLYLAVALRFRSTTVNPHRLTGLTALMVDHIVLLSHSVGVLRASADTWAMLVCCELDPLL